MMILLVLAGCEDSRKRIYITADMFQYAKINSPAGNQVVFERVLVEIEVENPENYEMVQLFANSTLIGQDEKPPFEIVWNAFEYPNNTTVSLWARGYVGADRYINSEQIDCIIDSTIGIPNSLNVYPIENYTDSSVILVWSQAIGNDFSKYFIQYGENNTNPQFENQIIVSRLYDTTLTIKGFAENSDYIFRVVIEDIYDLKSVSNEATITTKNKRPPLIRIAQAFRDTSIVEITWLQPEMLDFNMYRVYRSDDTFLSQDDQLLKTISSIQDTHFSDTLSGDSVNYYYLIELVDVGMLSSTTSFFAEFLPSHTVTITSPVSNSHVYEYVNVVVEIDADNSYTYVKLFNGTTEIGQDFSEPYEFNWASHIYPHGSVQQLKAVGLGVNEKEYSSATVGYVIDSVVGIPNASVLQPIVSYTDSSVYLVWNQSNENDFNKYSIEFASDTSNPQFVHSFNILNASDTTATIYGLTELSSYAFRIKMTDNFGLYSVSNSQTFTTLNGVPPEIGFVNTYRDTSIIHIEWYQPSIIDFSESRVYRSLDSIRSGDDIQVATFYNISDTVFEESMLFDTLDYFYFIEIHDVDGVYSTTYLKANFIPISYALAFDGSQCATVPYFPALNLGEYFTLEAWMLQNRSFNANRIIDRSTQFTSPYYQYALFVDSRLGTTLCSDDAAMGTIHRAGSRPDYLSWHHVAVTYNDGLLKFYIDGEIVTSLTLSSRTLCENLMPLSIGRRALTNESYFDGMIDEVRVWNVVRTPEEIAGSYQQSLKGDENGLVVYLDFNEGAGQIIHSPVGNNGFLGATDQVEALDPVWVRSVLNFKYYK